MIYTKGAQQNKRRGLGRAGMLLMVASLSSHAVIAQSAEDSRVRSANPVLLNLLSEGAERSATFAALVDAIGQSDGIVYVEFGYCAFGHLNGCLLPFIATSEHTRYLRMLVTPDKTRQSHDQLLALVAHEMQHAWEVLEHVAVSDLPAMQLLYRKIGTAIAGPRGGFETSAARAVGDAVLSEVSRNRRSPTHTSDRSTTSSHR
jgi:hypothetical protein